MFMERCFKNIDAFIDVTKEQGNEHLMAGV